MDSVNVVEARKMFSDLMARVAYRGERIIVKRRGKPMMALIGIEELNRLEAMDEESRPVHARRQAALALAAASRAQIRAERKGRPLPDSTEAVRALREERTRELADLR